MYGFRGFFNTETQRIQRARCNSMASLLKISSGGTGIALLFRFPQQGIGTP
jgi:hypothetical protein